MNTTFPCRSAFRWNKLSELAKVLFLVFGLGLLPLAGRIYAADVSYYGVIKSVAYQQTNNDPPALAGSNAYTFTAFVVASTNSVVTNATVQASNSSLVHQLLEDTNQISWRFEDFTNSQSALDAAYPPGSFFNPVNYTLTMDTTNDGVQSGSVNFFLAFVSVSYPPIPQLTNVLAAQDIDATRDFQLGWNSPGGSPLTIVQLTILDSASNLVYASATPFSSNALNGSSVSTVIPAYSLPPGALLQGHLSFANPGTPNTNSYPGATGVAALATDTQFPLQTRPAPAPPLLKVLPSPPGSFVLHLSGDTNRIYQIQAAADLLNWTNVFTTNSLEGTFDYTDSIPPNIDSRFYRAEVGQ